VGLIALLGPATAGAAGIIEGRVPVAEAPPPPALDQRYLQKVTGPIAAPDPPVSVVWVEGVPASPRRDGARAEVRQVQFQFDPGLLVVPVGTAVAFPNGDDTYHSIFSYSEPKRFDLGRYLKDEAPPAVVFDKPGLVRLFCEIHEHMRGYILVLDTPYFTKSDPTGSFRLEGVPAGRHRLHVWIDPRRSLERDVEVRDGEVVRLDLTEAAP
jgi:plastocyanin